MMTMRKLQSAAFPLVLAIGGCVYDAQTFNDKPVPGSDIGSESAAIAGGANASVGEFPWQIDLQERATGDHWCGGSILNEHWVITAAHCLEGFTASHFRVVAGTTNHSDTDTLGQIRTIREIRVYPDYHRTTREDIALLGLSEPLDLSTSTAKAVGLLIPADDHLIDPGNMATMSGWGYTSPSSGFPDTLQKLDMPIVPDEAANEYYKFIFGHEFAAGYTKDSGLSVCGGDSGGPLIVRKSDGTPLLAGMPSLTTYPCGEVGPVLFVRIPSFSDWITDNIAAPPSAPPTLDESNLSGAAGSWLHYQIKIPEGYDRFHVAISGGTGDADLYVRYGSQPTRSSYGCRPYLAGNEESCTFIEPTAGTWYISVRGYSDFSGVNLRAHVTNDINASSLSASARSWLHYQIEVPGIAKKLIAKTSGGTGDADLYVRYDAEPTKSNYAYCSGALTPGNDESCTRTNPVAGTWYVSVYGYKDFSGVDLSAYIE